VEDVIAQFWKVILAAIGAIAWLVRLEARANQNTRDLTKLELRIEKQRKEDLEARKDDWGRMEKMMDEMRSDIKKLLERGS
jgi:cell division protein FtsL